LLNPTEIFQRKRQEGQGHPSCAQTQKGRMPMDEKDGNKNVHTPHDRGYKRSLSHPGEFLHFLKKYVRRAG